MSFTKNDWIVIGICAVIAALSVLAFVYGSFSGGIVLGAVAIVGAGIYFLYLKKKPQAENVVSLTNLGMSKEQFGGIGDEPGTPGGTPLQSVGVIPKAALQECDAGVLQQVAEYDAVYPNWSNFRSLSDYRYCFIRANATTENGEPAFYVNGVDPTSPTGFGRVKAAGFCIGMEPHTGAKRPTMVLPYEATLDPKFYPYLRNVARFESEHCRERMNDLNVYGKYLGAEDSHPHPAREAAALGL